MEDFEENNDLVLDREDSKNKVYTLDNHNGELVYRKRTDLIIYPDNMENIIRDVNKTLMKTKNTAASTPSYKRINAWRFVFCAKNCEYIDIHITDARRTIEDVEIPLTNNDSECIKRIKQRLDTEIKEMVEEDSFVSKDKYSGIPAINTAEFYINDIRVVYSNGNIVNFGEMSKNEREVVLSKYEKYFLD